MARLVVLAKESPFSYYLVNRLSEGNTVAGVVFEKVPVGGNLAVLQRRVRRLGLFRVIDQLLLILFVRLVERSKEKRSLREIFGDQPINHLEKDVDTISVNDINSIEVRSFISQREPDLLIVSGTSLLKSDLIDAISGKILNIHVGITPEYRGAHGGFWALYNGEPENIGVTVHLINPGIDTGPIVFQEAVAVDSGDTLRTIVYRQQKKGVELVLKSIDAFRKGEMEGYYKHGSPSKLYYSPGLTQYLGLRYEKKSG